MRKEESRLYGQSLIAGIGISGNKVIQNGTVIAMDNLVEEPLVLINHLHLFKHLYTKDDNPCHPYFLYYNNSMGCFISSWVNAHGSQTLISVLTNVHQLYYVTWHLQVHWS